MNKLTKIGISALCGSLAAVSAANAGEMTVTGSANATYTKLGYGVTGNPLGMTSALSFAGSGELDNGNTFSVGIDHDDKNAWSAANITMQIGGMGTLQLDQGGGTGIDRLDDKMPTAKEEAFDTGVATGISTVTGVGGQTDIEWTVSPDMLPDGLSAYVAYSPRADGTKNNDKASGGSNLEHRGSGYDIVLEHSGLYDGLNVFAGYSSIEQTDSGFDGDFKSRVLGATYAMGSVTVGYQYSKETPNVDAGIKWYENNAYSIAFNVNDDLSISYGKHESERGSNNDHSSATLEAESMQLSYTMGGATIAIADSSVDHGLYVSTTANDRDGTTVWLTLAF